MRVRFLYSFQMLAIACAIGLVFALLVTTLTPYWQTAAARIALLALVTLSLNMLIGVAGLLSLASAAFMGMGAYGVTIFLNETSIGLIPAIAIIAVVCWLVGWGLGTLSIRIEGFYLALVTIGFLTLFQVLVFKGGDLTGAGFGLVAPIPEVFGVELDTEAVAMISAMLTGASLFLMASLLRSRIGRAWWTMKESHVAAEMAGIRTTRLKTSAFALTAVTAAIAGSMFGFVIGAISPSSFGIERTIELLAYAVVGGVGSVWGSLVGPFVLEMVPELMRSLEKYRQLIFGIILVLILIIAPTGIAGTVRNLWNRYAPHRLTGRLRRYNVFDKVGLSESQDAELAPLRRAASAGSRENSALEYKGVVVRYGGLVAVNGLSFKLESGALHGLIGANGAGKTTALNALTGHARVAEGQIEFGDTVLRSASKGVPPFSLAAIGVSRTFQTPQVVPQLSAVDNVKVGLHWALRSGMVRSSLKTLATRREEGDAHARSRRALEMAGFGGDIHAPVTDLAFGELRRLEIARAIVSEPRLLLLDEPTSGLEMDSAQEIMRQIREIQESLAGTMSVLVVEHNVPLLFEHCDAVTAMDQGAAIITDVPEVVRQNQRVRDSYLGDQLEVVEISQAGAGGEEAG